MSYQVSLYYPLDPKQVQERIGLSAVPKSSCCHDQLKKIIQCNEITAAGIRRESGFSQSSSSGSDMVTW